MRALALSLLVLACGEASSDSDTPPPDTRAAWATVAETCRCVAPDCVTVPGDLEGALCRTQTADGALVRVTSDSCPGRVTYAGFRLADTEGQGDFFVFENGELLGCSATTADLYTGVGSGLGLEPVCVPPIAYCLPCPIAYSLELLSALHEADIPAVQCDP